MMGDTRDPGITPRVTTELFEQLSSLEGKATYEVRVSYLQIYREQLHDLLVTGEAAKVRSWLHACL